MYDLIFLIFAVISLPLYLVRRRFYQGFMARLGILPSNLKLDCPIWIHAVSVGEAMAIRLLVRELKKENPEKNFVISTITPTGNKIARNIAQPQDFVTYLPFDVGFIIKSVIDRINPCLFIIAETEIWPNLISYLYKKNIPIVIVNGRISDNSFRGYLMIKFLLKPILKKITLFCVQTSRDAQRLNCLGVSEDKIKVTGNMKFDVAVFKIDDSHLSYLRQNLGLVPLDRLWVCGSTHTGEEEMILEVYKQLQGDFPSLKLLIAPRHPERSQEVVNLAKKFDFEPLRISLLTARTQELTKPRTVFILDTVGELINYYALAEIVFVGGSLVKKGGQNILEPAWLGKPILFGPYMFNFQDSAELFLANQAALLVNHKKELEAKIRELLIHPRLAQEMGQQAKELIIKNTGATQKNQELILSLKE